jgi:hypothetical protein
MSVAHSARSTFSALLLRLDVRRLQVRAVGREATLDTCVEDAV